MADEELPPVSKTGTVAGKTGVLFAALSTLACRGLFHGSVRLVRFYPRHAMLYTKSYVRVAALCWPLWPMASTDCCELQPLTHWIEAMPADLDDSPNQEPFSRSACEAVPVGLGGLMPGNAHSVKLARAGQLGKHLAQKGSAVDNHPEDAHHDNRDDDDRDK